jgi:hypothetical protein
MAVSFAAEGGSLSRDFLERYNANPEKYAAFVK